MFRIQSRDILDSDKLKLYSMFNRRCSRRRRGGFYLGPVRTTATWEFENTALFLTLVLLSTLIRHENAAI